MHPLSKENTFPRRGFYYNIDQNKSEAVQITSCEPRRKSDSANIKDQHSKATHILNAPNSGPTIPDLVFAHESSIHPPSLTTKDKMYHGDKSGILDFSFQKNFQAKGPRQLQQCLMELCSSR